MRPKLITPAKIILTVFAIAIAAALFYWQKSGSKILFTGVPSTAGKIAFVREENGTSDIYMVDGATGANAVALTSDGKGADSEPAWSPDGESLALTSDRTGVVRQIYLMDAAPGSKIVGRTNTSSTKEVPQYGPEDDVYYLDAGRIAKLSPQSSDIDAVFPTAEQIRSNHDMQSLFGSGGITRFAVSKDGERIFAAVKQERGEALVVWEPQEHQVGALGAAEKILFRFAPDDSIIAVFINGQPYAQPVLVMNEQTAKQTTTPDDTGQPSGLPPMATTDLKAVALIDKTLAVKPLVSVPFVPSGLALSSDGKTAALTSADPKTAGIFVFDTSDPNKKGIATNLPASDPAFSPDGNTLAFVSGDDIYTLNVTGGEPKNLTGGKGHNSAPIWSPTQAKK